MAEKKIDRRRTREKVQLIKFEVSDILGELDAGPDSPERVWLKVAAWALGAAQFELGRVPEDKKEREGNDKAD